MADAWGGAWGTAWGSSWGAGGVTPPPAEEPVGGYGRTKRKRPQRHNRRVLPDGTVIFASPEEYQALVEVRAETTEPELRKLEADLAEKPATVRAKEEVEDAIIRVADLTIELERKFPTLAPSDTRNETLEFVRLLLKLEEDDDETTTRLLLLS